MERNQKKIIKIDGQIYYEEFYKIMIEVIKNKNEKFSIQIRQLLLMDNIENKNSLG